jgi:hypothetical protein
MKKCEHERVIEIARTHEQMGRAYAEERAKKQIMTSLESVKQKKCVYCGGNSNLKIENIGDAKVQLVCKSICDKKLESANQEEAKYGQSALFDSFPSSPETGLA